MELKFLGFVVGNGKVLPDSDKISAITNFPRPIVKKDMRSFLGFINFYRKFVPNLTSYVVPLSQDFAREYGGRDSEIPFILVFVALIRLPHFGKF